MKMRIAIAAYGALEEMTRTLSQNKLHRDVEIITMNSVFSELHSEATKMVNNHEVDAFVSSGGNALTLKKIVTTLPVVSVVPTGLDIISVLRDVSLKTDHAVYIFFEDSMPDILNAIQILKDLLHISIEVRVYSTRKQLEGILEEYIRLGITDVVGGSLAIQMAAEKGLYGHYIITDAGLISAIEKAYELAKTNYDSSMQAHQLKNVLQFISEGVIATNQDDTVTVCNPSAERIFNIKATDAIGKRIDQILSNTRLKHVRESGIEELNQIQDEGSVKVLTNRIPIFSDGVIIGALATFRDINDIEEAGAKVRQDLYNRGLTAHNHFSDLIGNSEKLRQVISAAKHYAKSDATLLITSESGTGKELFAQSIHNFSPRSSKPFVAVNCAALPSNLLESELFGYEEGAFTGSKKGGKKGVFELADSGTVFLDEIGEISLETQAHLLRVLEQKEVMRIGGEKIRRINIRIIAATNKDLWGLVRNGEFRKDLYYRLNILSLSIPPLRTRKEDIGPLTKHYLSRMCPDLTDNEIEQLSNLPALYQYDWPGNVRELRNILERFSVLYVGSSSYKKVLLDCLNENAALESEKADILKPTAENILEEALRKHGGNKTLAAKELGIGRTTLWRKMKEYETGHNS